MSGMQPLRLEWTLATPMVASAHPLHLDALVAYAVTERALRDGLVTQGLIADLANELPIQRAVRDGSWCWQASALTLEGGQHSMRYWTRKTDAHDLARRIEAGQIAGRYKFPLKPYAIKIDTVRGMFKQHFKFYPVRQISKAVAWCVGNPDELGELLDPAAGLVTVLGAKARMGHGRIASLDITVDERANELWQRRVMPWSVDGSVPVRMAVRPPYWQVENVMDAYADPGLFA